MTSVSVTTSLVDNKYTILAEILPGGDMPQAVFIYENLFEPPNITTLGKFVGVCNVDELSRLIEYTGQYIPVFGNRFIKYSQAKIVVSTYEDVDTAIQGLIGNVKALSKELKARSSSSMILTVD